MESYCDGPSARLPTARLWTLEVTTVSRHRLEWNLTCPSISQEDTTKEASYLAATAFGAVPREGWSDAAAGMFVGGASVAAGLPSFRLRFRERCPSFEVI